MNKYLSVLLLSVAIVGAAKPAEDNESCYSFAGGSVYPDQPKGDHQLQYTKAVISKPAPQFEGTAVVNKEIVKLSLSQYLGKYVVLLFYPLDL